MPCHIQKLHFNVQHGVPITKDEWMVCWWWRWWMQPFRLGLWDSSLLKGVTTKLKFVIKTSSSVNTLFYWQQLLCFANITFSLQQMKRESAICGGGLVNCRGGEGGGFTIDIYTRDRINRLLTLRFNYCVSSSTSSSPLLVRIFPSTNLSVYLLIPFGGYYNNSCDINHEQVDRCLRGGI